MVGPRVSTTEVLVDDIVAQICTFFAFGVVGPRVLITELLDDLLAHILKRLDVTDLIRCKSVCKSWLSFISSPWFIKSHMVHSYSIDCNTRIITLRSPHPYGSREYEVDAIWYDYHDCHLLGSSNGLVCTSHINSQIVVANPFTREVKKLKKPPIPTRSSCWGFGYDSSTDDYKVLLGFKKGDDDLTCFQVLTLKSNVWKVIGDVNYSLGSRIGILCNGALHWIMKRNHKKVILSFHLSEEKFKEIPQPDESDVSRHADLRLGILDESLCVFRYEMVAYNLWVMKKYNVKESWAMVGKDREVEFSVQYLKELKHYIPHKRPLCLDIRFFRTREYVLAPLFVQSLVSPHVNGKKLKRKRKTSDDERSRKLRQSNDRASL